MQKLITKTINHIEYTTPMSKNIHDVNLELDYKKSHCDSHRSKRYQDEISGKYYQQDNVFHHNRQSNITGSNDKTYPSTPIFDYAVYIESLDPLDRENYLLKFRKNNPKEYLWWYANYITKVETQKLILEAKNLDCHATLKQSLDVNLELDYKKSHCDSHRSKRYQDEISGKYYQQDNVFHHNRQSNITDSNYKTYPSTPILDYAAHIKRLDPSERRTFLLKFRESNPEGYLSWYINYKTNVKVKELMSKTKTHSIYGTL